MGSGFDRSLIEGDAELFHALLFMPDGSAPDAVVVMRDAVYVTEEELTETVTTSAGKLERKVDVRVIVGAGGWVVRVRNSLRSVLLALTRARSVAPLSRVVVQLDGVDLAKLIERAEEDEKRTLTRGK